MSSLSSSQKHTIARFKELTTASDASAQKYLRAHRYALEPALDAYLRKHSGASPPKKSDTKALEAIFSNYADHPPLSSEMVSSPPLHSPTTSSSTTTTTTSTTTSSTTGTDAEIGIEGTIRYVQDLGLDLEEIGVLGLVTLLNAPTQGTFTKQGFIAGWSDLNITTLAGMKEYAKTLTPNLTAPRTDAAFKRVYLHTFPFALMPPARVLGLETGLAYWELLLRGRFARLDEWKAFVEEKGRGISRDTWNLLFEFVVGVNQVDLSDYDEEGAWPVIIDDFVSYARKRQSSG